MGGNLRLMSVFIVEVEDQLVVILHDYCTDVMLVKKFAANKDDDPGSEALRNKDGDAWRQARCCVHV